MPRPLLLPLAAALLVACGSDIIVTEKDEVVLPAVCDGKKQPDEEYTDAPFDKDGDGFVDGTNIDCKSAYESWDLDCNDTNPDVNPAMLEVACNGRDDDCLTSTPDALDEEIACNGVDDDCNPNTADAPDLDHDGYDACSDCDDLEPDANPGMDEICDDGVDNDCNDAVDEDCASDYSGNWVLESSVTYTCAFGLVAINFASVNLSHFDPSLTVSSVGGSQPGTMSGSVSGTTFSATQTLAGACAETYTIQGEFTGADSFEGSFQASFSGSYCYDCTLQSWTVYGHRN